MKRSLDKYSGKLTIAMLGNTATLNPALTAAPPTTVPGAQLFASLFLQGADKVPQPYLAKHWRLCDDGLNLTIEHRALAFPVDLPWAAAQPYDEVHWRQDAPWPLASMTGQ